MSKKERIAALEGELAALIARVNELLLRIEELERRPFITFVQPPVDPTEAWKLPTPWTSAPVYLTGDHTACTGNWSRACFAESVRFRAAEQGA